MAFYFGSIKLESLVRIFGLELPDMSVQPFNIFDIFASYFLHFFEMYHRASQFEACFFLVCRVIQMLFIFQIQKYTYAVFEMSKVAI